MYPLVNNNIKLIECRNKKIQLLKKIKYKSLTKIKVSTKLKTKDVTF